MIIKTRDKDGRMNGWVQTIWSSRESSYRPEQVYLTVVLPGHSKGPHLHKKRTGLFSCVQGQALMTARFPDGSYAHALIHPDSEPVPVPAGVACLIACAGDEPAYLINMPSPAWSADDPDEWPVEDWNPDV